MYMHNKRTICQKNKSNKFVKRTHNGYQTEKIHSKISTWVIAIASRLKHLKQSAGSVSERHWVRESVDNGITSNRSVKWQTSELEYYTKYKIAYIELTYEIILHFFVILLCVSCLRTDRSLLFIMAAACFLCVNYLFTTV